MKLEDKKELLQLFKNADKVLYMICRENGMSWVRARYIYLAVRLFGNWVLRHDSSVKEAP